MSDDSTFTKTEAARGAWAWATEHGAPERASAEQLVSWLARGELPPHTLVWKPGWGEWLPAVQVAELSAAFPNVTPGNWRAARWTREPSWAPPPVPVAQYPRLRLLAKDVVGRTTTAPFSIVPQSVAPAPGGRRALRDLDRVQHDLVTSQVPVAAMLEAARAMKRLNPDVPRHRALEARVEAQPALELSASRRLDVGTGSVAPRRTLSPLALELGFPALLEPEAYEPPSSVSRRYGLWLTLVALAAGALALLVVRRPSPPAPAPPPFDAETAILRMDPSESPMVSGPCRPSANPVRLDDWASRDVPITLASLPPAPAGGLELAGASPDDEVIVPSGWAAIGYAQSHETAIGLALAPESLEFERLVAHRAARSLFSMTPLVSRGELAFHADREGASVAFARTVDVDPPLRIGMNARGLVAGSLEVQAKKFGDLPPGAVISVPAVAAHQGGLTLAALVGRKHGSLRVGVMNTHGELLSELGRIGDADARFGRPALASGGGTTVLAVAARERDGSRQSIWLARAGAGQLPLVLSPFEPMSDEPIGGGGAELDAPAVAALPGGGFALLFTQGQGWKRRVRLSRLSSTLVPLEAPVDVTTPDPASRGASVGALHWVNDRLLAFHFLARGGGSSLWVSSIECEQR